LNQVWLDEEKKVFLANFSGSSMIKDSDNKYSIINDYWRKKTYVKDDEKLLPMYQQEFLEPYRVAQSYCGGTWNDYNTPFAIQVGTCNLNCFWCFVSDELRDGKIGDYFTVKEVLDMWRNNEEKGVLRITGGEPFLAPEFLIEIGKEIKKLKEKQRYLWIDTNLLGKKYDLVAKTLSDLEIPFGICGCFKGFDKETFRFNTNAPKDLFNKQFNNARTILNNLYNNGELFFYVPEILENINEKEIEKKIINFYEQLTSKVHELAPLRVTVLKIKSYEANKEKLDFKRLESGLTRKLWFKFLKTKYPINKIWLPQYQINLKNNN